MDATIVRSVLVPALVLDLGRRTWWPSALSRAVPSVRASAAPRQAASPERSRA
jgi:RND superfamily putative drug exporter